MRGRHGWIWVVLMLIIVAVVGGFMLFKNAGSGETDEEEKDNVAGEAGHLPGETSTAHVSLLLALPVIAGIFFLSILLMGHYEKK